MQARWFIFATLSATVITGALSSDAAPPKCRNDDCDAEPGVRGRGGPPVHPPHVRSPYEGHVVKGSGPALFLVEAGKRRAIPDMTTYDAMGLVARVQTTLTDAALGAIPTGDPLPHRDLAGSVIRHPKTNKVYYVQGNKLLNVPRPSTLQSRKIRAAVVPVREAAFALYDVGGDLPSQASSFTFSIDSFTIHDLRAHTSDTDVAFINARVGGNWMKPVIVRMGDLGKGEHKRGDLKLANIAVPAEPDTEVLIDYAIYNGGGVKDDVLQKAAESAAGYAPPAANGPTWANAGDWLFPPQKQGQPGSDSQGQDEWWKTLGRTGLNILGQYLWGRLFASCDGSVAWGQIHAKTSKMLDLVSSDQSARTTDFPGLNSPTGCGGNSHYAVTWSLSQQ